MKNIVLIHCRGGYQKNKFYSTIKNLCQETNIEYFAPQILQKEALKHDWFVEIDKIKDKINNNSILIGHSMGAIALCRYISENNLKFDQLHLVAPWFDNPNSVSVNATIQGKSFEPNLINWNLILKNGNKIFIHISKDDKPNRLENAQKLHKLFKEESVLKWYQGYGHFEDINAERDNAVQFFELEDLIFQN
jgi:predicted alpha/beta hydrolase family esterase